MRYRYIESLRGGLSIWPSLRAIVILGKCGALRLRWAIDFTDGRPGNAFLPLDLLAYGDRRSRLGTLLRLLRCLHFNGLLLNLGQVADETGKVLPRLIFAHSRDFWCKHLLFGFKGAIICTIGSHGHCVKGSTHVTAGIKGRFRLRIHVCAKRRIERWNSAHHA